MLAQGLDGVRTVFNEAALEELTHSISQQQQHQHGGRQGLSPAAWRRPRPARAAAAPSRRGSSFDPAMARLVAGLQSIAYCADTGAVRTWSCRRCPIAPGFVPHLVHFDPAWDLSGYAGYLPSLDAKVLVFRGTDSSSWANWVENMRAWRTDATYPLPGAPPSLRIHSGFHALWNSSSMAATFLQAFSDLQAAHPRGPTLVIGHSMGGALAQLCALDLVAYFGAVDVRTFTFGSPRVGNAPFAAFLESTLSQSWRFTHGRDIVPSVPPPILGFRHASREVWLVDVDPTGKPPGSAAQRMVVCDESGEDPTCHSSTCHLGLCTSIVDHLFYLQAHMFAGTEC